MSPSAEKSLFQREGFISRYESEILVSLVGNNSLWSDFLSISRHGAARNFKGQSINIFFESISVSIVTFSIQLVLFNFLKNAIPAIYQPNILLEELQKKIQCSNKELLPKTLNVFANDQPTGVSELISSISTFKHNIWSVGFDFKWVYIIFLEDIKNFESMNIDSFYFLRFISKLQSFFAILTFIISLPLITIHLKEALSNQDKNVKGLDNISIYTVSSKNSNILIFHFCFTIFTVCIFHWFLLKELKYYCKSKLNFVKQIQSSHEQILNNKKQIATPETLFFEKMFKYQSTVLINNMPHWSYNKIMTFFNKLEANDKNAVSKIWYIPKNIKSLIKFEKKHINLLTSVEEKELLFIYTELFAKHKQTIDSYIKKNSRMGFQKNIVLKILDFHQKYKYFETKHKLSRYLLKFSLSYSESKIFGLRFKYLKVALNTKEQLNTLDIDKQLENYFDNIEKWKKFKYVIQKKYLSYQTKTANKTPEHLKHIVIRFNNLYMADFFCQLLLTSSFKNYIEIERNINFHNLNWFILTFNKKCVMLILHCAVDFMKTAIIICWAIPVAFLGLILQIPYLTIGVPFLNKIYALYSPLVRLINNLLPIISLIILTEVIPDIFRWLIGFKVYSSFDKIELNLQKWIFIFLFVQVFIVFTVSSSISVIIEQVITNPTKIPKIMASNFPQCSNFFVSFVFVRGIAYSIGNMFQWARLISWVFSNKILFSASIETPRKKFEMLSQKSLVYKWGSIYPIFTLMSAISIIYSIIQPLILPALTLSFGLVIISFKFTIRYQVNRSNNKLETLGMFYPVALFQLYSGVYCLQGLMIGIFVIHEKYWLSSLTLVCLVSSVVFHCQIYKKYSLLVSVLPLCDYEINKQKTDGTTKNSPTFIPGDLTWENFNKSLEIIPVADPDLIKSVIWIPDDDFGISSAEIDRLKFKFGRNCHITNTHAKIDETGEIKLY
ncbi:hypothetical protein QEN19_001288 [Hanseniaspora menglaensis]